MDVHIERVYKGPGFAETLYLDICKGQRIIRKASNPDARDFSRTALVRKIRLLQSLCEELKPFFPEVLSTNLKDQAEDSLDLPDVIYYDMPYYSPDDGWVTFSEVLLDGSVCRKEASVFLVRFSTQHSCISQLTAGNLSQITLKKPCFALSGKVLCGQVHMQSFIIFLL